MSIDTCKTYDNFKNDTECIKWLESSTVEANKQEALKWYTLSANNDNKIGKQLLESLAQKKEEVVIGVSTGKIRVT